MAISSHRFYKCIAMAAVLTLWVLSARAVDNKAGNRFGEKPSTKGSAAVATPSKPPAPADNECAYVPEYGCSIKSALTKKNIGFKHNADEAREVLRMPFLSDCSTDLGARFAKKTKTEKQIELLEYCCGDSPTKKLSSGQVVSECFPDYWATQSEFEEFWKKRLAQ